MSSQRKKSYADLLRKCADLADIRGAEYGEVYANFLDVSEICFALFGKRFSVQDVARIMIATKWSREKHKHNPDNLIDVTNYTAILAYLTNAQ